MEVPLPSVMAKKKKKKNMGRALLLDQTPPPSPGPSSPTSTAFSTQWLADKPGLKEGAPTVAIGIQRQTDFLGPAVQGDALGGRCWGRPRGSEPELQMRRALAWISPRPQRVH